ncbi:hypothetical protein [Tautonia plasticadhaerens]|uniref:Uncharacterized protein n=1 Tax=Tautonia plasticadhaerens TaxID=2527974 RepID=A0A518GZK3_9BACT|nr:hypothetical protein [Tautonia plasticadhaerens]QDV34003.1 hypothetical protein ElP_18840 [Tautonia plasticadhaerens]
MTTLPFPGPDPGCPIPAPTVGQFVALYHKHRLVPVVGEAFARDESGRWGADLLGLLLVEAIGLGAALDLDDAERPGVTDPATGTDRSAYDAMVAELPWPEPWLESLLVGWAWEWCGTPAQDLVPAGAVAPAYRLGREASRILIGATPIVRSLRTVRTREDSR